MRFLVPALMAVSLVPPPNPAPPDDGRAGDRQLLAAQGVGDGDAALLDYFRHLVPNGDELERLDRLVGQLGDPRQKLREQAGRDLLKLGPAALRRLRREVDNPVPEIAARARRLVAIFEAGPGNSLTIAAAHELTARRPPEAVAALLGCLPYLDDPGCEHEIVQALQALDRPGGEGDEALVAALSDPAAARRSAAVAVLGRRAVAPTEAGLLALPVTRLVGLAAVTAFVEQSDGRARIRPLLADVDPAVRWQAAAVMARAGDRAAVPVFIELVGAGPEEIGWQAENWLFRLAGEPGPVLPAAFGPAGRTQRRQVWANWWQTAAATADLGRFAVESVALHLTILTHMHSGRVVEINREGKEVWGVGGFNGPIDARVLAGGHVLVAEHGGRQVGVYDRAGKPIWQRSLPDSPVTCDGLPGGNVFVTTYTAVYEFRADGREVHSQPVPEHERLYAAQRLPNGHVVGVGAEGLVLEFDLATGRLVKKLQLNSSGSYGIEKLPSGNLLVASYNSDRVREFDPTGKVVWEVELSKPYHATRLPTGNSLVSSASHPRVVEVNPAGKVVWEQTATNPCWHLHRR